VYWGGTGQPHIDDAAKLRNDQFEPPTIIPPARGCPGFGFARGPQFQKSERFLGLMVT